MIESGLIVRDVEKALTIKRLNNSTSSLFLVFLLPASFFLEVDKNVLSMAQTLVDRYDRLNPRDSIHIASALSKKIKQIISDDKDFDIVKEIKRTPLL